MREEVTKIEKLESVSITYARVLATLCIVACHWFDQWLGIPALGQLFNVGVPVFFIISGFLYGRKQINGILKWYFKQFWKIVIPVYAYYAVSVVILLIMGDVGRLNWKTVLYQLLNLQGFLYGQIGNVQVAHLWFITYILLCYLITPLLQKLRDTLSKKTIWLVLAVAGAIQMILVLRNSGVSAVHLWGVLAYISGYFFGAYHQLRVKKKGYILLSLLAVGAVMLRVILNRIADGGAAWIGLLYERAATSICQIVLAWWILITVATIVFRFSKAAYGCLKPVRFCDRVSFEIYIVHQALMLGTFDLLHTTFSLATDTLLLFVGVSVGTAVVRGVTLLINRLTGMYGRGMK